MNSSFLYLVRLFIPMTCVMYISREFNEITRRRRRRKKKLGKCKYAKFPCWDINSKHKHRVFCSFYSLPLSDTYSLSKRIMCNQKKNQIKSSEQNAFCKFKSKVLGKAFSSPLDLTFQVSAKIHFENGKIFSSNELPRNCIKS